jgi:hypothetical protein
VTGEEAIQTEEPTMARSMTVLTFALIAMCCAGCGDAGAPIVMARQSAPPKPAAPPSGEPAEKPVKPGSEVPAQFGGRQFVQLLGRPQVNNNAAGNSGGSAADSSAPSQPTNAGQTNPPNSNPAGASNPTTPAPSDASAPTTKPPATDASAPTTTPPAANSSNPSTPSGGGTVEPARVGVGVQGKDYGTPDAGLITTPIAAYFTAREQIAFIIQIPDMMRTFQAVNGRYPKSHEEFMKEIIQAGSIKLPELPEGAKYVYDPQQHELTVVHPKPK